jgi:Domain of unknown function (DUF4160)
MPTILRESGFAVMVYTDDHRPMHVHVWHQGNEAVLEIEGEVHIRENIGMSRAHLRRAVRIIEDNLESLRNEWRRIHES